MSDMINTAEDIRRGRSVGTVATIAVDPVYGYALLSRGDLDAARRFIRILAGWVY